MDLMKIFEDIFNDNTFSVQKNTLNMKTDLKELDDKYILEIDLPGFTKEDVLIQLDKGVLTIKANKKINEDDKYIYRERFTEVSRTYKFNEATEEKDINAKLENGTLIVEVKKQENTRNEIKTIKIK